MGITQNGVVWITKRGAAISLCIVNFAIIAKFCYDSENCRHSKNLNFAMHSNFRYDSENLAIAKFSLGLRNFRYHCEIFAILAKISLCHSEIPDPPALLPAPINLHFFTSSLTLLHPGFMKSPRIHTNLA